MELSVTAKLASLSVLTLPSATNFYLSLKAP